MVVAASPVRVEATLDEVVVASGLADLAANFVPGDAAGEARGFLLILPEGLDEGLRARLIFVARDAAGARFQLSRPEAAGEAWLGGGLGLRFVAVDRISRPVFVMGAHRSATSAMGRALRRSGHYAGHGEGHVLPLLARLREEVATYYQAAEKFAAAGQFTMLAETPETLMMDGLSALFVRLGRAHFPGGAWMEKTPGAASLLAAPMYRRIWPEARFMVMQRRGIENLVSARLKFPERDFGALCVDWAAAILAARSVLPELGAAARVVEQLDLARDPTRVGAEVAEFLNLDADAAARLGAALRDEQPQRSTPEMGRVLSLTETGWTADEVALFRARCGAAMAAAGYSFDKEYWADRDPGADCG